MAVGTLPAASLSEGVSMGSSHYSTFSPKTANRSWGRMTAFGVSFALLALVGIVSLKSSSSPSELQQDGTWTLINECSLFGCHTERKLVVSRRQLEAEHAERLQAMKSSLDKKLMAQRHAMEISLNEVSAKPLAGLAKSAGASIMKAFAKVDSENPVQKQALAAAAKEKAKAAEAAAEAKEKERHADTLQKEAKKALADEQTVQKEMATIKAQAAAAENIAAAAMKSALMAKEKAVSDAAMERAMMAKEMSEEKTLTKVKSAAVRKTVEPLEVEANHIPADLPKADAAQEPRAVMTPVAQAVQQEVAAIKTQAVLAMKKIKAQERAEVEAIEVEVQQKQSHSDPITAPAATAAKQVALPVQDGPRAAHFKPAAPAEASSVAPDEATNVAAQKAAVAAEDAKLATQRADVVAENKAAVAKALAAASKVQELEVELKMAKEKATMEEQAVDGVDGDKKPRAFTPKAAASGYWKQSLPSRAAGRESHKSLKVASSESTNQLSLESARRQGGDTAARAMGRDAMTSINAGPGVEPAFDDKRVAMAEARTPLEEFAGESLTKKRAAKGHQLHLDGWLSSNLEKAMGIGSQDKDVRGDSPRAQRALWSTLVGGQAHAGEEEEEQQQEQLAAAHPAAVSAGKLRVEDSVDRPAIQRGMGTGGFDDKRVTAKAASEPLWEKLGLSQAKAGSL